MVTLFFPSFPPLNSSASLPRSLAPSFPCTFAPPLPPSPPPFFCQRAVRPSIHRYRGGARVRTPTNKHKTLSTALRGRGRAEAEAEAEQRGRTSHQCTHWKYGTRVGYYGTAPCALRRTKASKAWQTIWWRAQLTMTRSSPFAAQGYRKATVQYFAGQDPHVQLCSISEPSGQCGVVPPSNRHVHSEWIPTSSRCGKSLILEKLKPPFLATAPINGAFSWMEEEDTGRLHTASMI